MALRPSAAGVEVAQAQGRRDGSWRQERRRGSAGDEERSTEASAGASENAVEVEAQERGLEVVVRWPRDPGNQRFENGNRQTGALCVIWQRVGSLGAGRRADGLAGQRLQAEVGRRAEVPEHMGGGSGAPFLGRQVQACTWRELVCVGELERPAGREEAAHEGCAQAFTPSVGSGQWMIGGAVRIVNVTMLDVDRAVPTEPGGDRQVSI